MHGVELERVLLSIPFVSNSDGQGFIGHSEKFSSWSF